MSDTPPATPPPEVPENPTAQAPVVETPLALTDEKGELTEAGVVAAQAGLPGWVGPAGEGAEGAQPFDTSNKTGT
jgi:hypothetical protein